MAHVNGSIFLDEGDEFRTVIRDGSERPFVAIKVGNSVDVIIFADQLDLLRRLAIATAEAERDLEAIVASIEAAA